MHVLKEDCSPTMLLNAAKAHTLIIYERKPVKSVKAFTQNARNEVRFIGDNGSGEVAGALSAEPGSHQTTYILIGRG